MLARTTNTWQDISYDRLDDTHGYDDCTLGKTSWRLTNGVNKLWKLQTAMQRQEFEQAFADDGDGMDPEATPYHTPQDPYQNPTNIPLLLQNPVV